MIDLLENAIAGAPEEGALLGMDVGKKTIGLALSQAPFTLVTPLTTIKRIKFGKDVKALLPIIKEYDVRGFIIGLPLNMDGTEGPRAQSIRDFAMEFAKHADIIHFKPWIRLHDERLSTRAVEQMVDEAVDKRKTRVNAKQDGLIDKLAAQHILQNALDIMQRRSS